ncbi:MAG TPA: ABC transporter ATP-binding protein [Azospirillum sp.]|nr:ABC transporter ATP-binding protein [Azospirillum sp.]
MHPPLIDVQGVTRTYRVGGRTVAALHAVDLTVRPGEFVAVVGRSGSGKSTLLNILGLLDQPDGGRYRFGGEDVGRLSRSARAALRSASIGFVFQSFNLLARSTALENVELPLIYARVGLAERRRRAAEALAEVGLAARARHAPGQLSGGEQQRVAIARAIANDPSLILADEPTGALDSRTGLEILALLQALNRRGRSIVLVTHDATVARHTQRIVSMHDGRIVAEEAVGSPLDARTAAADGGARRPEPVP